MTEESGSKDVGPPTDAAVLTEKPGNEIGVGTVTHFPEPKEDGFGRWHEQVTFTTGCRPLEEIENNGVVIIATETTFGVAERRVIEIGRTPVAFDPRHQDGTLLGGAGAVGDFLMGEQRILPSGQPNPERTFTYLDADDLQGVVIKNRNTISFLGKNPARENRILTLRGKVRSVVARH